MAEENDEGAHNVFFFSLGILTNDHRGTNSIYGGNGLIATKLCFTAQSDWIICNCHV